jgi:hypothetical protein
MMDPEMSEDGLPDGNGSGTPDLDTLPGLELPSADDFVAQEGTADPLDGFDSGTVAVTDLGWPFCLLFNGRPWQPVNWKVDTAAEAAGWMDAYTRWVNAQLVRMGYPAGICTWVSGSCQ